MTAPSTAEHDKGFIRAQLRFGWIALALFLSIGMLLEALHGFKLGWYLDVGYESRRLMLTLGHAHGTLLAVLNLVFVATSPWLAPGLASRVAAYGLRIATVLLPSGFILGGIWLSGSDPSLAVLLVPLGGLALLTGVISAAIATR